MDTCRDVIGRAFQKIKVYSPGETPSNDDEQVGLDELQSLYEEWAAGGMFGRLRDRYIDSDYTACQGERITVTNGAVVTIPTTFVNWPYWGWDYSVPTDDLSPDSTKPPYDMALIEVVDIAGQSVTRWLYDVGQTLWVNINGLTLDSIAPLSSKGRGGLIACLALNLADEYGGVVGPSTARQAAAFKTALSLKLGGDTHRSAAAFF